MVGVVTLYNFFGQESLNKSVLDFKKKRLFSNSSDYIIFSLSLMMLFSSFIGAFFSIKFLSARSFLINFLMLLCVSSSLGFLLNNALIDMSECIVKAVRSRPPSFLSKD